MVEMSASDDEIRKFAIDKSSGMVRKYEMCLFDGNLAKEIATVHFDIAGFPVTRRDINKAED